jgi:tetratricopeptide (TPR) repeat protein
MMGRVVLGAVLVVVLAASVCGKLGDFRKNRHMAAAERYVAEKKWKEATIEYRNVLRYDPENLEVVKNLGLAYYESGQIGDAFPPLRRFSEANPTDLEVRQKLGAIYLMGRAPDKAMEQAEAILAQNPLDVDALLLLAESSDTPEEIQGSIARLEQNRAALAHPDRVARALGVLYARNQDLPKAEEEFKKAVLSKPDSPEGHLALARLHLGRREFPEAEKEFKAAADLTPSGSFARLQLADFYLLTRRTDDAVKVLDQITAEAPDAFPAWLRLGEVAYEQGKLDQAQKAVDLVLGKSADDASALALQTRLHLAARDSAKALGSAQKAVKAQPSNGLAHYALALAHAASGNNTAALSAVKDAVTRSPRLADAVLLLAELQVQAGDPVRAIAELKAYLEKEPAEARAWEALGKAQLRTQDSADARESFSKTLELAPTNPRGPYLMGLALRAQGRPAEARVQFERALTMAPSFVEPLEELAAMSLAEKNPQAAVARIERQILIEPRSGALHYLLGQAYQALGDTRQAEKAFLTVIEINPQAPQPFVSLGQIYSASRDYDRAIAQLDKALAARPDQPAALMLKSIAQAMKGDVGGAREGYEKLLKAHPRFAPAGNNLAWMLAEDGPGQDLERALLLAQAARDAAPLDPHIADTLGWVHYKRGNYLVAEVLLSEAALKLPTTADVLYHLGMAQARMGRNDEARASLGKSLELQADHAGAAEAKATLASIPARN